MWQRRQRMTLATPLVREHICMDCLWKVKKKKKGAYFWCCMKFIMFNPAAASHKSTADATCTASAINIYQFAITCKSYIRPNKLFSLELRCNMYGAILQYLCLCRCKMGRSSWCDIWGSSQRADTSHACRLCASNSHRQTRLKEHVWMSCIQNENQGADLCMDI